MRRYILYIIAGALLTFTACRDDFADTNTPPDKVTSPDPVRLFSEAITLMDGGAYTEWFYNHSLYLKWTEATVSEGGNPSGLNLVGKHFGPQTRLWKPKLQIEELRHLLAKKYTEEEAAPYRYLEAVCNPILVYLGLHGTDMYGSMAYTEASTAPYTSPPVITPRYQTQQELMEVWIAELDRTIAVLTAPVTLGGTEIRQVAPGAQDFFYGGDWQRWAKLANSLKLKIAARMLGLDRERALEIAAEVAASPAGIVTSPDDDLIYQLGGEYYRFGEPVENAGIGSNTLIDFLRANRDPRLRFLFAKNDFNASVVQAFFDAGRELPPYILELADYTEVGGQKTFTGWKAPGEPWVRYHGAPVDIQAPKDADIQNAYFNTENFRLPSAGGTKTYRPLSLYNEEMVRGGAVYTFPSAPDAAPVQDNTPHPWHGALYCSAEANLYLAEFALLGASLPETAETYYNQGVELSVRLFDRLARLNDIPYYKVHAGFDASDKTIALTVEEIAPLIDRYKLTGTTAQKLEQVYIQQYIHHLHLPQELLVTVRRSGYPAAGSALLPRMPINSADPSYAIPRRIPTPALDPTDGMYEIKKAAYQAEGFTPGSNSPALLESERVDYDKNAPAYGQKNTP